jgi:hypothetical protein
MFRSISTALRVSLGSALVLVLASPAVADDVCMIVNGTGSVVFDPVVGGFVGPVDLDGDGDADATSTAIVLSLVPTEDGTLHAVTTHTIVLTSGAAFTTLDHAVLSPSDTAGLYRLNSVLDIQSGASGKLTLHGDIHLLEGWAVADVHGRVCGLAA